MVATQLTRAEKVSVFTAAVVGIGTGILVTIPLTDFVRARLGLTLGSAGSLNDPIYRPFTEVFWLPWLISWGILLVPGIVLMIPTRTHLAGLAYLVAVGTMAGIIALVAGWLSYAIG